jgi:TRAP-type C4-dicarboxylate transport system substrate-binding protein
MRKINFSKLIVAGLLGISASSGFAQEITLKFHHLWPSNALAPTKVIGPWCDKIAAESNNRMKCQILHSMSGGGTPPQLLDRVKDGVDDLVITLPGYTPGRFPLMEVFELPFMSRSGEAMGGAAWEFAQKYAANEFVGFKPLAVWGHDAAYAHTSNKQIKTLEDYKGLKMRGPTRQVNKLLVKLGSTPVAMPASAVADSISKGTIDGFLLPWELVGAFKMYEVTKFHTEIAPKYPSLYSAVFFVGMNQAKYDSLSADLKAIIDRNSGINWSRQIGKHWDEIQAPTRQLAKDRGNTIYVLPDAETERWIKASESVKSEWVAEINKRGVNGEQLLKEAADLLTKHSR